MKLTTIRRCLDNERGTTLTEFVITLPVFIVSFVAIVQLGMFTEKSVKTWARAHKNTFQLAIPSSQIRWSPMAQPSVAAGLSLATMGLGYGNHMTGAQKGAVAISDIGTYGAMGWKGHWGESNARTMPIDAVVTMHHVEGYRTQNSNRILGSSRLARDLVSEDVGNFSGRGSGKLAAVNALLSGSGLRPAMAAGMRYGAVGAYADDSMSVAGRNMNFRAAFTSLVPPFPLKGLETAVPVAVTRVTMENQRQYSQMLGIKWSQPYPGGSISVPSIPFPGRTR